jgi:hypothetical protein
MANKIENWLATEQWWTKMLEIWKEVLKFGRIKKPATKQFFG